PTIRAGETYALDRDLSEFDALAYWIGPECAAQQAAKVRPRTMNCGDRNTFDSCGRAPSAANSVPVSAVSAGGRLTRSAAGT
ncbi:hypothetical protein ACC745_38950, partial [Rhizobium ruizarguesonis]